MEESWSLLGQPSKSGSISWQPNYSSSNNNQYQSGWNGVQYDADGNLLNDTFNTYSWNVYGSLATVNGATVTNDAFGRMVENASRNFEFIYSPADGSVLAAMNGQTLGEAYVPLPGGAGAGYNSSGLNIYMHKDWLGSLRMISLPNRTVQPIMNYAPFGEGYGATSPMDVEFTDGGYSFTVLEPENGGGSLQDFMFRRYNPTQGRWISPDPAGLNAAHPGNPQTWNRYAYVANQPTEFTDPLGLDLICCGGGGGGWGDGYCPPEDATCDPGCDPVFGCGGCDPEFGCGGSPGGPSGPPVRGGGGNGNPAPRRGGVWPNNETLGLPGGLNAHPFGNIRDFFGLLPNIGCGDFVGCGTVAGTWADSLVAATGGAGTANNPYSFYVLVLAAAIQAANNGSPTRAHCAARALSKNALSLTTDALGFIPGESLANTVFQLGVGITGTVNSAINRDVAGSLGGIAGIHVAAFAPFAKEAGWSIAKSVPGFGMLLNGAFTLRDLIQVGSEIQKCASGG
jgi:RHS repeat-associated protein